MFITIINDSNDDNAKARQETRYATLFPNINISYVGINSSLGVKATIQASGNLIDILDASQGQKGIIAVNVAPRGQIKEDGENGSRFSYFTHKDTIIVSTIKAYNYSLVKKLGITDSVNVFETKEVLDFAENKGFISSTLNNHIAISQFRSFDFQPRVAKWLMEGVDLPSHTLPINKILDPPQAVWHIDSFGNIKTTLTSKDIPSNKNSERIQTNLGTFTYYNRLKDVPDGETAFYLGSSGIGDTRFIEVATQNRSGSAAKHLNLKIGDEVKIV